MTTEIPTELSYDRRDVLTVKMTVTEEVFFALICIIRAGRYADPQYADMLAANLLWASDEADRARKQIYGQE